MHKQFDIFLQRKSHQLENSCVFWGIDKELGKAMKHNDVQPWSYAVHSM